MIKYYKNFFILNEEDKGFKDGGNPVGYVKIEAREGKGKLDCHVSNLKCNNLKYKLYIMKADEREVVPFCLGQINFKGREGELKKNIDPSDVGGTGISIEHFNVAAVLVDSSYEDNIICPLAAYKGEKTEWRNKLKRSLSMQNNTDNGTKERKDGNFADNKETSIKDGNKDTNKDANKDTNKDTDGTKENKDNENNSEGKYNKNNNESKIIEGKDTGNDKGIDNKKDTDKKNINNNETSIEGDKKISEKSVKFERERNDMHIEVQKNIIENDKEYSDAKSKAAGFDIKAENIIEENLKELVEHFDRTFRKIKPFRAERKDYKWWQILNPADLNNIFYKFNIKIPVLFNPLVMMAHFKYKHMIVGLYEDQKEKLQYVVCGIPGLYWVDEKPYGEMCRWAQVEGDKPRYGAFGYWLIYINPATGRILSNN